MSVMWHYSMLDRVLGDLTVESNEKAEALLRMYVTMVAVQRRKVPPEPGSLKDKELDAMMRSISSDVIEFINSL